MPTLHGAPGLGAYSGSCKMLHPLYTLTTSVPRVRTPATAYVPRDLLVQSTLRINRTFRSPMGNQDVSSQYVSIVSLSIIPDRLCSIIPSLFTKNIVGMELTLTDLESGGA